MEYIIGIAVILGLGFLFGRRSTGRIADMIRYERKDAELQGRQAEKESQIDEIENRIKNAEEKLKGMTPKEVEDYWNNDN